MLLRKFSRNLRKSFVVKNILRESQHLEGCSLTILNFSLSLFAGM